jgi:hypothetical protein
MIVTMFGLALFFIYREVERVEVIERRQAERRKRLRAGQQASPFLLGGPPEVVLEPPTDARNMDFKPWRIVRPVLSMIAVTAIFSIVFFYNAPRSGNASWDSGGSRNMVGFSPEVTFDQMGQVLLSNERVMRVNFNNPITDDNYTVIGEPYFRGGVLTKYLSSGGNGQWRQEIDLDNANLPLSSAPNVRELVRQDVLMEPTGSRHLFSVFPVYAMAATHPEIRVTPRTRKLIRDGASVRHLRDDYRFSVVTSAFRFGTQGEIITHSNRLNTEAEKRLMDRMNRRLRFIDNRRAFPKLIELAEQIVQDKAPEANNYEKAKALEQHFLDEEAYKYSLNFDELNARRQPGVDPVEDFASNHRTGHCEYFASALTLMLRSQGIPARMIVGYRGGEFNYVGNYFLIRQKHAHAWVEAYLKPDEIPAGSLDTAEMHPGGGWLRLDPTPGRSNAVEIVRPGMFDRVSKSFDYAQWLWSDYVLGLTPERQRNALMGSWGVDKMLGFEDLAAEGDWQNWIKRLRGLGNAETLKEGFSWRAGVAALLVSLALYGIYRFLQRILPLFKTVTRMRRARRRRLAGTRIEFYKRFESLVSKLGLRRQPGETQREFAQSAASRLAESTGGAAAISDIPHQIVNVFYDVRFGNTPLSEQQTAEMDGKLEVLKKAVSG